MKFGTLQITGEDWSHTLYGIFLFINGGIMTLFGILLGFDVEIKIKESKEN